MGEPLFIGDELSAAGFRLPGIRIATPAPDELETAFAQALDDAPLVIITTTLASALGDERLTAAVKRAHPPVAVVPDAGGVTPMPDLARRVRLALGVEA